MGQLKKYDGFMSILVRFGTGAIIGFVGVAMFTTNAYLAVIVAVVSGVIVDRYFANRGKKDE